MTAAYQPIITPHGEVLHSHSLDEDLREGDLVLIDVGAETSGGWAGDVTRTWPVSGQLRPTQRDIVQMVTEAQRVAIEAIRPGVAYVDVHIRACIALAEGLVSLGILKGSPLELVERDAHALFMPHGMGTSSVSMFMIWRIWDTFLGIWSLDSRLIVSGCAICD